MLIFRGVSGVIEGINKCQIGGLGPGGLGFESRVPMFFFHPFMFGDPKKIQSTGPQTTNLSYPKNHGISSSWWFGDPTNPAKNTSQPLKFAGLPVILRVS